MISVAIPTHDDRVDFYIKTIENLYDFVDEVIVLDDASNDAVFKKAGAMLRVFPKVALVKNSIRQGVFRNKFMAVNLCSSNRVALLDSDNIFTVDYIKAFMALPSPPAICCPVKALPRFDFSKYSGKVITQNTVSSFMDDPLFCVHMNTGNYIVDRHVYLDVLRPMFVSGEKPPSCCDVIWANYHILKAGHFMYFVPGMEYEHTDHPGSTYRTFVGREPGETEKWQDMVRSLCQKT